ncbi:MAG: hypothetical protein ACD_13C00042G0003 [uncultured bacterium]|nr:MAG: hypothetical protein ACD_13C00042G0003 [uncultured bacterium]
MERLKVSQVAKKLGVTTQAVYKRLATVGEQIATHVTKEKGVTYLTTEGVEILREIFGTKPQEGISGVGNLVATLEGQLKEQKEIITNQQKTIEALIFQQEEARKRSDTILMKLTNDISSLQKTIEYKHSEETSAKPENEKQLSTIIPKVQTQIHTKVFSQVMQKPQVQRDLSMLESIQITFTDFAGFLFGRG